MAVDFLSVTELAGDEVTREQIKRLCNRYYWGGTYCNGLDIVEVACGSGQGLGYLNYIANSIDAGDYSDRMIKIAGVHYKKRIRLCQFDAQHIPFKENSKDVVILFEAIYYLHNAAKFVKECLRILRPGGTVLISTANKDLYDFCPSPHSYTYFGTVELNDLFSAEGFKVKCYGDTPISEVSWKQKLLRPVKKVVINIGLMPKSMAGKKFLKRLVFGGLVKMPAEIGTKLDAEVKKQDAGSKVYQGHYAVPVEISVTQPDHVHKVIFCMAQKAR